MVLARMGLSPASIEGTMASCKIDSVSDYLFDERKVEGGRFTVKSFMVVVVVGVLDWSVE
jgi:hypothetical protein